MSSKKKKNVNPWVLCDNCNVVISEKDLARHDNHCPFNKQEISYPVIQNKSLICLSETFNSADASLLYLPKEKHETLVILTQAALQLCEIIIGDPIVLIHNGSKAVKKAWKGSDRPILSAAVYEKNSLNISSGDPIEVKKLTDNIHIAGKIVIESVEVEIDSLLPHLQQKYAGEIFCVGNTKYFEHFGKPIVFNIVAIESLHSDVGDKSDWFESVNETIWCLTERNGATDSRNNVEQLGGLSSIQEELDYLLPTALNPSSDVSGNFRTKGILLYGPNGTGKSTLMKNIARKWCPSVLSINCSNNSTDICKRLEECSRQLQLITPSILIIDDITNLPSKGSGEQNVSTILASTFDQLHSTNKSAVIMATTTQLNLVEKSLRRPGRFDLELEIGVPNPTQRREILKLLVNKAGGVVDEGEIKDVADVAHGFVGADLMALVSKAVTGAARASKVCFDGQDLLRSLSLVKPSALREIMVQVPDVKWDDIGGQEQLKHELRQAVEWPLKHPESFRRLGIRPPRGVLMYGPPGCSKTMIAKALATESGLNFISVKGPELFSKWVGESEKAVREVFRRARQCSPSIVFFDELDALAGERAGNVGGSQVQERVLAQLLTELDGVEALGHVIVVGATNRPDRIDPALMRPGRLDRVVHVPLPDHRTRREIFVIQFRKTPIDADVVPTELADLTKGYSGAEVVALCHEAALKSLDDNMDAVVVSKRHFLAALEIVTPRTPASSIELCKKYIR